MIHLPRSGRTDGVDLGGLTDLTFEAVIFDLDGTLIDSTPAVIRSWTIWAEEHGVSAEQLTGHHGVPAAGIVSSVLPDHLHATALARITELEMADVDGIGLLPGAVEALADLAEAKNAIATSCTRDLATARIAAAQLTPPTVIVTADDITRGKPAPDPFLEAARRLDADPGRCLVVEDAPAGLQAAIAAGCRTLAVISTNQPEALRAADAIVPSLAEVKFSVTPDGIRVAPRPF